MDRLVLFLMAIAAVFVPLSTGVENVVVGNSSFGNASFRPECTTVNNADLVSCLPTFIIAGTQKSGTTVLAALLSGHPMVRFSRRKETHFFDRIGPKDAASYLKLFPPWDSNSRRLDRLPIYGEATPSYISSRNSCKHIAEVVPNVKLIILVREPVARAYSEYQMKSRRVAHQKEFISLLMTNKKRVIRCMAKHPADYPAITQCVPSNVSQHSRWTKLIKAWKKSTKKLGTWTEVIEGCFPHHQNALSRSLLGKKREYRPAFRRYHTSPHSTQEVHYNVSQKATFDPVSCWRHYPQGFETIKPLRAAMIDEIDSFQACRSTVQLPGICLLTVSLFLTLLLHYYMCFLIFIFGSIIFFEDLLGHNVSSVESRLEHLDRVVDQCLRVRGGISSQYFYRSMYAVQLHHCFQVHPYHSSIVSSEKHFTLFPPFSQ